MLNQYKEFFFFTWNKFYPEDIDTNVHVYSNTILTNDKFQNLTNVLLNHIY